MTRYSFLHFRDKRDSNTTNFWHHIEVHHSDKDPRPNKKAKKLIEGQSTLYNNNIRVLTGSDSGYTLKLTIFNIKI